MGGGRTRLRTLAVVGLLGSAVLMAGCGQKGPLYLPTEEEIEKLEQRKAKAEQRKAEAEQRLEEQKAKDE
jgi:predicted small lipoprotein YifL